MSMLPDYRHKFIVPVIHRRERRAFQMIVYGLRPGEANQDVIIERMEQRGFSILDWYPVWDGVHIERTEYHHLSIAGRKPHPRGVYDA